MVDFGCSGILYFSTKSLLRGDSMKGRCDMNIHEILIVNLAKKDQNGS